MVRQRHGHHGTCREFGMLRSSQSSHSRKGSVVFWTWAWPKRDHVRPISTQCDACLALGPCPDKQRSHAQLCVAEDTQGLKNMLKDMLKDARGYGYYGIFMASGGPWHCPWLQGACGWVPAPSNDSNDAKLSMPSAIARFRLWELPEEVHHLEGQHTTPDKCRHEMDRSRRWAELILFGKIVAIHSWKDLERMSSCTLI